MPFSYRQKKKDEKMEERRQKEEGQKRKGTERRKKEKEARERRPEKRQQSMSQKGTFLTQESRKGAGRGFPCKETGNGAENAIFCLMPEMTVGGCIFLHFSFPFALVNMGEVGHRISPYSLPFPAIMQKLSPLPSLTCLHFHMWFTLILLYGIIFMSQKKKNGGRKKC